ncbi:hypothetical protein JTE90_003446 [Oedothorax gibbosus]|uniref:Uncharacterized protein n=1 Tax=Oedothorax gibbosus TaxID=931172 RepID=A0AAV6TYU2_9ARAC|nr:hypothetical protein JTE90_003446 [Oedothorax gibbosus]
MPVRTFATSAGGTIVSKEPPLDAVIVTDTALPMTATMPTSKEEYVTRFWQCRKCYKVLEKRKCTRYEHKCWEIQCKGCKKYVGSDYQCYLPSKRPKSANDKLLIFDVETDQSSGDHVVNFVVSQYANEDEKVFKGYDALNQFCTLLFTKLHKGHGNDKSEVSFSLCKNPSSEDKPSQCPALPNQDGEDVIEDNNAVNGTSTQTDVKSTASLANGITPNAVFRISPLEVEEATHLLCKTVEFWKDITEVSLYCAEIKVPAFTKGSLPMMSECINLVDADKEKALKNATFLQSAYKSDLEEVS